MSYSRGSGGVRSYYEHDDRSGPPPAYRGRGGSRGRGDRGRGRGNQSWDSGRWHRGSRGSRGRGTRSGPNPRSRLEDEDSAMAGDDMERRSQNRYNPYGGRRPRRGRGSSSGRGSYPNRQYNNRTDGEDALMKEASTSKWHKVMIPFGAKHSKNWLLKSITNLCEIPFTPIEWHEVKNQSVFYIDDIKASRALSDVSKRITTPEGYKVVILVRPSGPPRGPGGGGASGPAMSEESKQTLTEVMSKRYDPSSKLLNLSDLYNDEDLKSNSIRCSPNQPSTMAVILDIISANIPETIGLDLSSNRFYNLNSCKLLREKAPNVTSLNLSNNNIKQIDDLKVLKGLRLTELILDKNPLCDSFTDKARYVRAVRDIFRDVIKLDGHDLEPEVSFDLEAPTTLPPVGPSFFPDDEIKKTILQFLERYYTEFDSESRSKLIDVYHESAKFSMSVPYEVGGHSWVKSNLIHHFSGSRNIKNDQKKYKSQKLLKQGRLQVAAFLSELPRTQHDLNSFLIDVSLVQADLMHFTVSGVLMEVDKAKTKIAFNRTFIVCPGATGLVILNDHLSYRQPSEEQRKSAFSNPGPTPTHSPVSAGPGPSPVISPVVPTQAVPDATIQQQMIEQFVKDSGMNAAYSQRAYPGCFPRGLSRLYLIPPCSSYMDVTYIQRCLEENGWDYPKAGEVFLALKNGGQIPQDAFT